MANNLFVCILKWGDILKLRLFIWCSLKTETSQQLPKRDSLNHLNPKEQTRNLDLVQIPFLRSTCLRAKSIKHKTQVPSAICKHKSSQVAPVQFWLLFTKIQISSPFARRPHPRHPLPLAAKKHNTSHTAQTVSNLTFLDFG